MFEFFKRLFCKHNYQDFGQIDCTFTYEDGNTIDVPILFLVCPKCGKRKIIRRNSYYYNDNLLKQVHLWEKGLYNFQKYDVTPKLRRIK